MTDTVRKSMERMKKKDAKAHQEFVDSFEEGSCKKGKLLQDFNQVCNRMYILKSGITKQFRYKEDGNEHITWFGFSSDVVIAYRSFVRKEPSTEGIKALEDCEYYSISRDRCYELAAKYHACDTFFREMLENYYIQSEERMYFLLALNAKQKYNYLYENFPHFIQRLPSSEISSFIGVSRETLSRIRSYG